MLGRNTRSAIASLTCLFAALAAGAAVMFDAPCHVAAEGAPVVACGDESGESWTLLDWRGRPTGSSGVFDGSGRAMMPRLKTGYYLLTCGGSTSATLAVVPDPATRPAAQRSFYGADTAASGLANSAWFDCPWNKGDRLRTVAELARLAGLSHVRDRFYWREAQPSRDAEPDFSRFVSAARLFKALGIGVSVAFHDAPRWARPLQKLPGDLYALYGFCHAAAAAFGDSVDGFEFWNEPDIGFAPEPVWDYAAALKAAYLGAKAARPGLAVLGGALCRPPDSPYERTLFANGAARYFDVFNYHSYAVPSLISKHFETMRGALRRAGAGDRPVWITECGTNLEGPGACQGGKGRKSHSPGQELVVAEYCAKAQVLLQMEGVERNYFFVLAAYNERNGEKDWGLLRRDGTAKPAYAAMSAMTRELSGARIAGELRVGKDCRAFLFERPGGVQTVAFWAESPMDAAGTGLAVVEAAPDFARPLRLKLPQCGGGARFRLSDLCGAVSEVAVDAEGSLGLEAARFPAYVSGLRGLRADEPARKMQSAAAPSGDRKDEDLSVVFRVDLEPGDFDVSGMKALAVAKAAEPRLRVQVWNFGDAAKTGAVEACGARLRGLPAGPVALGPRGSAPLEFGCVLEPENAANETELTLRGTFDGRAATPLAMPVFFESRFLASCEAVPLGWKDPTAWKRNDSAAECKVAWDEKEGAVRFDVAWTDPKAGRWFYPRLPLALPRESLAGAKRVSFEIKTAQDKVENDFGDVYLMLLRRGRKAAAPSDWLTYAAPTGAWERRYVDLPAASVGDLADVVAVCVGANPKGMRLSFWIRNMTVLK